MMKIDICYLYLSVTEKSVVHKEFNSSLCCSLTSRIMPVSKLSVCTNGRTLSLYTNLIERYCMRNQEIEESSSLVSPIMYECAKHTLNTTVDLAFPLPTLMQSESAKITIHPIAYNIPALSCYVWAMINTKKSTIQYFRNMNII